MPYKYPALIAALLANALVYTPHVAAQNSNNSAINSPGAGTCTDGRGPTSGFFCAPLVNNESVRACATDAKGAALAQCRQTSAVTFCRAKSYGTAVTYQVTPSGNLAEVLCQTPAVAAGAVAAASAPAARPAAAPAAPAPAAPAPAAAAPMNSVYATTVSSEANPTLTLSAFGPKMTGTYTVTRNNAFFDSIYQSGGGTITEGRIEGTLEGDVLTGYWFERPGRTAVQRECDPALAGERIYGRFTLRFSADRKSFTGLHSTCDGAPEDAYFADWNGRLTSMVPAQASAAQSGRNGSAAASPATAQTRAGERTRSGNPTAADRIAQEAADEAERRVGEKVRDGVRSAIDGISPF
jgi:hypothetical protein